MPAQHKNHTSGEVSYVHIYNVGLANKNIFNDSEDYSVFLEYLREYLSPAITDDNFKKSFTIRGKTFKGLPHQPKNYHGRIDLVAFNLKPNHFHLLLSLKDKQAVERFIRSLCTRYAIYFNKKYKTSGSLFHGPYKSATIAEPDQLIQLSRFMHKIGTQKEVSSYEDYLGNLIHPWVNPQPIMVLFENTQNSFFKGKEGYKNFVEKYTPGHNEEKLLKEIALEEIGFHTQEPPEVVIQPTFSSVPETTHNAPTPNKFRLPEIALATAIFFMLFGLGINNILASNHKIAQPKGEVAGVRSQENTTPTPPPSLPKKINFEQLLRMINDAPIASMSAQILKIATESSSLVESTDQSTLPAAESSHSVTSNVNMVLESPINPQIVIKITDGSKSINIRKEATVNSEILAQAKEGEIYELTDTVAGWFKIINADGQYGFISPKYAVLNTNK